MQTIKIKYQIFKVVSKLERHLLINEKQLNISIYLYFSNVSLAQISTEKRKKGEKEKRITPLCHTPKIQYSGKKIKSISKSSPQFKSVVGWHEHLGKRGRD